MQDQSDGSFDLPGGGNTRRSPTGSNNSGSGNGVDLLMMGGNSDADAYQGDKYISGRRSGKREKKMQRKSSKRMSNSSSSKHAKSSGNNNNNSNSLTSESAHSLAKMATAPEHTAAPYLDDSTSSYAGYAEHKYVKPPKATTNGTTNDEINALLSPSSMADPNDPLALPVVDNFQDEFEDEMDEIEMREEKRRNFDRFGGTAETSRLRKYAGYVKLYAIPVLVGVLFLLGLAAGILYLIGFGKSDDSVAQKILQAVPVAPETLKLMCDKTTAGGATNTFEVPDLCHAACRKASCCWNPDGIYACTTDTQQQCPPYEDECAQWKDEINDKNNADMVVPAFDQTLTESCATTAFETTVACTLGCQQASCCWDKKTSTLCSEDSVHNCGNYREVCDFLNESTNDNDNAWPFPAAPQGLSVYCDPGEMEEISLHICEDRCGPAECCWKKGVTSCKSTYPSEACRDYALSCDILNQLATAPGNTHDTTTETAPTTTSSSSIPTAPSDLASTCAKDQLAGEGLIACETSCLKAACCWQPNLNNPCTDDASCAPYNDACSVFSSLFNKPDDYDASAETLAPVITTQVAQADSDLFLTCNPDVLKPSVDNGKFIVQCEKKCLKGACCWKTNHPTLCPDATECEAYMVPCGEHLVNSLLALESGGSTTSTPAPVPVTPAPTTPPPSTLPPQIQNNVPEAAADLQMICAADVLKLSVSDGEFIVQCEKECLEGACCWKENHSTICPNAPQCLDYVPCLAHLKPVLEAIEGTNHGLGGSAIPAAPADMAVRCSLSNLVNNADGRGFCEESCKQATCCWLVDAVESCSGHDVCSGYTECANLLTTGGSPTVAPADNSYSPPVPAADLQSTCAAGSIIEMQGLEKCRLECEAASCCWDTGEGTCSSNSNCQVYQIECELMRKELNLNNVDTLNVGGDGIAIVCDANSPSFNRATCDQMCATGSCCFDDTMACFTSTDCTIYQPCSILVRRRMLRQG